MSSGSEGGEGMSDKASVYGVFDEVILVNTAGDRLKLSREEFSSEVITYMNLVGDDELIDDLFDFIRVRKEGRS